MSILSRFVNIFFTFVFFIQAPSWAADISLKNLPKIMVKERSLSEMKSLCESLRGMVDDIKANRQQVDIERFKKEMESTDLSLRHQKNCDELDPNCQFVLRCFAEIREGVSDILINVNNSDRSAGEEVPGASGKAPAGGNIGGSGSARKE